MPTNNIDQLQPTNATDDPYSLGLEEVGSESRNDVEAAFERGYERGELDGRLRGQSQNIAWVERTATRRQIVECIGGLGLAVGLFAAGYIARHATENKANAEELVDPIDGANAEIGAADMSIEAAEPEAKSLDLTNIDHEFVLETLDLPIKVKDGKLYILSDDITSLPHRFPQADQVDLRVAYHTEYLKDGKPKRAPIRFSPEAGAAVNKAGFVSKRQAVLDKDTGYLAFPALNIDIASLEVTLVGANGSESYSRDLPMSNHLQRPAAATESKEFRAHAPSDFDPATLSDIYLLGKELQGLGVNLWRIIISDENDYHGAKVSSDDVEREIFFSHRQLFESSAHPLGRQSGHLHLIAQAMDRLSDPTSRTYQQRKGALHLLGDLHAQVTSSSGGIRPNQEQPYPDPLSLRALLPHYNGYTYPVTSATLRTTDYTTERLALRGVIPMVKYDSKRIIENLTELASDRDRDDAERLLHLALDVIRSTISDPNRFDNFFPGCDDLFKFIGYNPPK